MTFDSTIFLFVFLPVSFILYYVTPVKFKTLTLALVSVLFYAWGGLLHTLILIGAVFLNYAGGMMVERNLKHTKRARNAVMLIAGIDVLLLAVCKWAGQILGMAGGSLGDSRYFLVPLGISFFMLQNISYIIDIYREEITPQRNLVKFSAMIMMYPKITAGPLVSAGEFSGQLEKPKLSLGKCSEGLLFFVRGLSKKVILGNALGMLFDTVIALPDSHMSVVSAWVGSIAFALRIYFTFGGYCDMAEGLSRMLGFTLPENVNYPILSTGIMDFWSRWMATLWKWFCSYVYLPLCGGNPGGAAGFLSLFWTWVIIGLWHGLNGSFVIWGIYFAVLLYLEGFVFGEKLSKLPKVIRWFFTMLLLLVSWVFFFCGSAGEAFSYLRFMLAGGGGGFIDAGAIALLADYGVLLAAGILFATPLMSRAYEWLVHGGKQWQTVVNCVVYVILFVLCVAGIVSGEGSVNLYF